MPGTVNVPFCVGGSSVVGAGPPTGVGAPPSSVKSAYTPVGVFGAAGVTDDCDEVPDDGSDAVVVPGPASDDPDDEPDPEEDDEPDDDPESDEDDEDDDEEPSSDDPDDDPEDDPESDDEDDDDPFDPESAGSSNDWVETCTSPPVSSAAATAPNRNVARTAANRAARNRRARRIWWFPSGEVVTEGNYGERTKRSSTTGSVRRDDAVVRPADVLTSDRAVRTFPPMPASTTATERLALVDRLASAADDDWARPSLCDGWSVHDVVAHLTTLFLVSKPSLLWNVVTAGGVHPALDRFAHRIAASHTGPDLLAILKVNAENAVRAPLVPTVGPMADVVVHSADVRWALGDPHEDWGDPARLLPALQFLGSTRALVGFVPPGRMHGLRFAATDQDWTYGDGDDVRGPSLSLLMAILGRPAALEDLDGDGVAVLAGRITR